MKVLYTYKVAMNKIDLNAEELKELMKLKQGLYDLSDKDDNRETILVTKEGIYRGGYPTKVGWVVDAEGVKVESVTLIGDIMRYIISVDINKCVGEKIRKGFKDE